VSIAKSGQGPDPPILISDDVFTGVPQLPLLLVLYKTRPLLPFPSIQITWAALAESATTRGVADIVPELEIFMGLEGPSAVILA
jgi:hypothetical protein